MAENATAVRRNITVGDEVDYYTEVTGGDLAEGDMLIYDTTFSIAEDRHLHRSRCILNRIWD